MEVSAEQAREYLVDVRDVVRRTRKMAAYAGADVCFIIWGVVWTLGFLATHFIPPMLNYGMIVGTILGWTWTVLCLGGVAATYVVTRSATAVRTATDTRIWWIWWFFYIYIWIWGGLLAPFIRVEGHEQWQMFWRHMGAIASTAPMFMYVLMGLWLDMYMLWLGLSLTALTLVGVYLLPGIFFLWMAIVGGGTLIGTWLLIRNRWR